MQVFCSAWVGSLQCLGTLRMSWTLASARCHRSTSSKEILFIFLSESVILLQKDKLTVQALWQSPDQYAWPRLWQLRRPRFVSSPSYQPSSINIFRHGSFPWRPICLCQLKAKETSWSCCWMGNLLHKVMATMMLMEVMVMIKNVEFLHLPTTTYI